MLLMLALVGSLWPVPARRSPRLLPYGRSYVSSLRSSSLRACAEQPCAQELSSLLKRWYSNADTAPPPLLHTVEDDDFAAESERRITHVAARAFADLGSKSQAQNALKRGALTLNGAADIEGCRLLKPGDVLALARAPPKPPEGSKLDARLRFVQHMLEQGLRTVHEDDDMAVVFKPAGVHTKRNTVVKYGAFEDALPAVLSPPPSECGALPLPLAVHRLDVRVCGLVLVAKSRLAARELADQFARRSVSKRYEALLVGEVPAEMLVCSPVQLLPARTRLERLSCTPHAHWGALSHVSLSPETGRTHQLRVHCASLGAPIVGDDLYWEEAAAERLRAAEPPLPAVKRGGGLFLQSVAAGFEHPRTGEKIEVEIPTVDKFTRLLDKAQRASDFDQRDSQGL